MPYASAPILLLQGGAGNPATPERAAAVTATLHRIAHEVWPALDDGASALDAVVDAVRRLEDDPLFNAGLGSKLQADGRARLSAALMDGAAERFSGVVNVEGLANPILLARALQDDDCTVLAGEGAMGRARELGLREADVRTAEAIAAWEHQAEGRTGTVGAVALDRAGRLAAATSTGGRGMERPGRVSDSCTPAGNFASPRGAASATGVGEHILAGGLAVRVVQAIEHGADAHTAAQGVWLHMEDREWQAGLVALDASGHWSVVHTTPAMTWQVVAPGMDHNHDRPWIPPRKPGT